MENKMNGNVTTRKFEPWYRLVTPFHREKSRGDGYISEQAESILANPIRNISIRREDHKSCFSEGSSVEGDGRWEPLLNEREKSLIFQFCKNPESELLSKNDEPNYVVSNNIPREFNLLKETYKYGTEGTNPFPIALNVYDSSGNFLELRDRRVMRSHTYLEQVIDGEIYPDKEAIDFMKSFIKDNLKWLVDRGGVYIDKYWVLPQLKIVPEIYDRLMELGAE